MHQIGSSKILDFFKIIFIFIVILAVIVIISSEIIKNNKIRIVEKNFLIVKDLLTEDTLKCKDQNLIWIFELPCIQQPSNEIIAKYFNNNKKLINPFDKKKGVNGSPGSVLISQHKNIFILQVDIDANGGIDIEHRIFIN